MSKFTLPPAPAHLNQAVKAWRAAVTIPTYSPMPADVNPMFLENRVYQGSSGKVYPLPFTDRISEAKEERRWDAIHIENEYVRLMILPEIGGRIHVGLDKTTGYDFFYRQNVIKPALVGLAGPWISGGVEFNWPQHHRPSTFMPVQTHIENHADGSVTIWCSEHEPMNRMKGMHGICLHPGKSVVELKVRLYNRTELTQTFLWWANVAARVHEKYQSFFPPDVSYGADHAKRAMSRFPGCEGVYYGVNYGERARTGEIGDKPRMFPQLLNEYPPNDLTWYANIPVPTSYMAMGSREDFFGGYDHAAGAGLIHVADHHISPGKKQWTWGNHEFGYAWDRNLTDEDGPYIELMAGVYTDNQPDFSFLHPGETRVFSQYWYPISKIGPAQKANLRAAISIRKNRVGIAVTETIDQAIVSLLDDGKVIETRRVNLSPREPLVIERELSAANLLVRVMDSAGDRVIEYRQVKEAKKDVPPAAAEPAMPADMKSIEELYLTGVHLEQYRHATRKPELYWREALKREPGDVRCNTAMGVWHIRRGEFKQAAEHLEKAIATQTRRNSNPNDGEASYYLGVARRHLSQFDDAYDAFYKATWNYAWQSPAFVAIAEIDCRRGDWEKALEHLNRALRVNAEDLNARNLKAIVLEKLGRSDESAKLLRETLALDPLDFWARDISGEEIGYNPQLQIDLSLNFARAGIYRQAAAMVGGVSPMDHYARAFYLDKLGDKAAAKATRAEAKKALLGYCFPSRVEEIEMLQSAIEADPTDARAPYLLGNLMYDRRRHKRAIELWEKSVAMDPNYSVVWRNLGIAYFNILSDAKKAREAYQKALAVNPNDARLVYERDQLWKRCGIAPVSRLAELEKHLSHVNKRDDLSVEYCALLNQTGRHEEAQRILSSRTFQPWEGGEGLALGQHVRTHLALGRKNPDNAKEYFLAALDVPENLGEWRHLLANQAETFYWCGLALGDHYLKMAAESRGDFQEMGVRAFSEMTFFSAMAIKKLGRSADAELLLRQLLEYGEQLATTEAKIDYFATSLPAMLLFQDDIQRRQNMHAKLLIAQARLGLGETSSARKLLEEILADDPSDPIAADLIQSFCAEEYHAT